MKDIQLPQFTTKRRFDAKIFFFSDKDSTYDLILGRDLLEKLGIIIDYKQQIFIWDEIKIPIQKKGHWTINTIKQFWALKAETEDNDNLGTYATTILDANYEKQDLKDIVDKQTHLTIIQRNLLYKVLSEYKRVFEGKQGEWKGDPVEIELKSDAKPYHAKPYRIPHSIVPTVKKEINRFCDIKIIKAIYGGIEWAAASFAIPNKDQTIRIVTDFRVLNKRIKRKPYPQSRIEDMLNDIRKFRWATCIDQI